MVPFETFSLQALYVLQLKKMLCIDLFLVPSFLKKKKKKKTTLEYLFQRKELDWVNIICCLLCRYHAFDSE